MKCEAEQPSLAATSDERGNIEKRGRQNSRTVVDDNLAGLQGDEQAPGAVAGMGDADGTRKAAGELFELQIVGIRQSNSTLDRAAAVV